MFGALNFASRVHFASRLQGLAAGPFAKLTNSNSFDASWLRSDLSRLAGLPAGVLVRPLQTHVDERGELTELFRTSWTNGGFCQWNYVKSKPGTLRGVHVHLSHTDYLVFVRGRVSIALTDLRQCIKENFAVIQSSCVLNLDSSKLVSITIPPGVAHGFYFLDEGEHFYGTSTYFDIEDELGCLYSDSELGLDWHPQNPLLSQRDKDLPLLRDLLPVLRRRQTESGALT